MYDEASLDHCCFSGSLLQGLVQMSIKVTFLLSVLPLLLYRTGKLDFFTSHADTMQSYFAQQGRLGGTDCLHLMKM